MAGRRGVASSVDTLGALAASVVVVVAFNADVVRAALDVELTFRVLTIAAAAVGAAAAILGIVATRLTGEPRPAWIAAALVLYCVVVLPWSTVGAGDLDVVHRASRLVAYLGALVLLVLSVRPPRPLRGWGGWLVVGITGLLAVATLGLRDGPVLRWFVEGPLPTVAVLVGWTAAAVAFVVDGHRRGSRARLGLGLGLVVLAVAQLYRVAPSIHLGAPPAPATDLAFAALRLLGLAVVLVALARMASRALGTLASEQWRQQEELAVAALHMERAAELAAERDHELRNGLAGLAGITHLLSSGASGTEHERLRHAVLAELSRLHTILDGGDIPAEGPRTDYLVEPVLSGLVALRPAGDVTLAVPDGLAAHGDSAVLAQIVTNLLANCDRHAPGAPITISARADRTGVAVEVRDEGPGLPAGAEDAVLHRGVHDEAAGGSGLGLHISRRLVATQGGSLSLRTVTDPGGCSATVTVPSAQTVGPIGVPRSR